MDTSEVASHLASHFTYAPLVILLSTLYIAREASPACASKHVHPHCLRPGVGFWLPPPAHVETFWRSLVRPSVAVAQRVRRRVAAMAAGGDRYDSFIGVHMRGADGSCPTRVAIWYEGKRLEPSIPKCGKIAGCTSLDESCCDFRLVAAPQAPRFSEARVHEIRSHCEEALASGELLRSHAWDEGVSRVFVAADGQYPQLEAQLLRSMAVAGLEPFNENRSSRRVWSSRYARRAARAASAAAKGNGDRRWQLSDVSDALVDMYVLAEAKLFLANPASSFSATVRDMRSANGKPLATTQVGIPPHDQDALRRLRRLRDEGEGRAVVRRRRLSL